MLSNSKDNPGTLTSRIGRFEEFESRIVMSAQAVATVLPDADIQADDSVHSAVAPAAIVQALNNRANTLSPTTAAAQLAQQYGLDGTGQTIAVIDTGIAFDHVALGGGYGAGHRVVGGYDFAENDNNPYDDGPTGFHGTHVAGIIGSTDLKYTGLAPGADLVALRVFDDAGRNELEWVEQALQWVHDNQHNFENPITTVNLSLGTTPDESYQQILEEELAQLKRDGIFVSVAAGNHFDETHSSQLAYPASSSSVVPVASHTASGEFSDFSQRAPHVLTAPGQSITSTVPAHLFYGARTNPFVGSSGTSMAAPYVAGASALLRQANEMVGVQNVNQDLLYEQLRSTADQVFDSVTGTTYAQVNLQAAIESVLKGANDPPEEQPPSQEQTPLNPISNPTPNEIPSVNTERPQAESQPPTPTVETPAVIPVLNEDVRLSEGVLSIKGSGIDDVVALTVDDTTQTLTVRLNDHSSVFDLSELRQINYSGNGGNDDLSVTLGDSDDSVTIKHRKIQILNELFQLNADDITVVNIDNATGNDSLNIQGSHGDDRLSVSSNQVSLENGNFQTNTGQYQKIYAHGRSGNDSVRLTGTAGTDIFAEYKQTSWLKNDHQRVLAAGFEQVSVDGGGGSDHANFTGTDLAEQFHLNQTNAKLVQGDREIDAAGFGRINVIDAGAHDSVSLTGSNENEILYGRAGSASFVGDRFLHYVSSFEHLTVDAGDGQDAAYLAGSSGNDHFRFAQQQSTLSGDGYSIEAGKFDLTVARPGDDGHDTAAFEGTNGNDRFFADNTFVESSSDGMAVGRTIGFDEVSIDGRGGDDLIALVGSHADDALEINHGDIEFETTLQMLRMTNLEHSHFNGGGGEDRVTINDVENLDLIKSLGSGARAVLRNHTATFNDIEDLEANAVDHAIAAYDLEKVDFRFNLGGKWYDAQRLGF